ncbi:MAG: hypothetical protein R3C03_20840 [Pirellulaceae bacterium]
MKFRLKYPHYLVWNDIKRSNNFNIVRFRINARIEESVDELATSQKSTIIQRRKASQFVGEMIIHNTIMPIAEADTAPANPADSQGGTKQNDMETNRRYNSAYRKRTYQSGWPGVGAGDGARNEGQQPGLCAGEIARH